jgi:hypothetical protein
LEGERAIRKRLRTFKLRLVQKRRSNKKIHAKRYNETLFFLKRKIGQLFFLKRNGAKKKSETERKQICKVVKRHGMERNGKFEKRNETKRKK